MKVVILAGGKGSTISHYTQKIPKPMVTIGNIPMLTHIMGIFKFYGFELIKVNRYFDEDNLVLIFKNSKKGDIINFEKSIKYGEHLSGHFVQGHVDTTSKIIKIKHYGKSWIVDFYLNQNYKKNLVQKGSITINGVSLTIAKLNKSGFQITLIPKTLKLTNLIYL